MLHIRLKKLILSALFMALGLLLPFLTGQIPTVGQMLLPMHIPVLLCGMICGWPYGLLVGAITPLLRSLLFTKPALYPMAVSMAFELATYGAVVGVLYYVLRKKPTLAIYGSLVGAMLSGRVVLGIANTFLYSMTHRSYTFAAFLAGAFLEAIPGIILQLILIPTMIYTLQNLKLIPLAQNEGTPHE